MLRIISSLFVLLLLALLTTSVRGAIQTQPSAPVIQPPSLGTQQVISAGLWRVDGGFVSTMQIKNGNLLHSVTVTPILYMSDGQEYALSPVHLDRTAVTTINVNKEISRLPDGAAGHRSEFGSAALRLVGSGSEVLATMLLENASASLSYITPFSSAEKGTQSDQTLEGLWWRRKASVNGFVGLSNSTANPIQVTVQSFGSKGSAMPVEPYLLAPHETKLLDLQSLTSGLTLWESRQGGLRVHYPGNLGDVNIVGGLESIPEGYSAIMPFWLAPTEREEAATSTTKPAMLSHVGIMVGHPDPMMHFPDGIHFTPYLALRNVTPKPINLTLTLYPEGGQASQAQVEHLRPNESRQVDMAKVMARAGLADFDGMVTLTVSHAGQITDVVEAAGSIDEDGSYVFEVEGRGVEQSLSKQTPYWKVGQGNDTMVSLWNGSANAEDIVVTLHFRGGDGQYQLPFHLAARGSASFDLRQLILEQKQDMNGRRIPLWTAEGSVSYASADGPNQPMTLSASVGVYNVQTATCFYGCISCDGYTSLSILPNPLECPFGDTHPMGIQTTYSTGANYGGIGAVTWSSSNTAVATIDGNGLMSGDGLGTAMLSAEMSLPRAQQICAYDPICSSVAQVAFQAQSTVTVKPTVTIQVEDGFVSMAGNGLVLLGGPGGLRNTAITAVGKPSGGAVVWSAGPKLQIAGINSANGSVSGTAASISAGDTYVFVTYTLQGQSNTASFPFTVQDPKTFHTNTYPGGSQFTTTFSSGNSSGYQTTITYYVYDQMSPANTIDRMGIPFAEVLSTTSNPFSGQFDPPDNTPKVGMSDLNGAMIDQLSAIAPGGLPLNFSAARTQNFTVNGFPFSPVQQQKYSTIYAEISISSLYR